LALTPSRHPYLSGVVVDLDFFNSTLAGAMRAAFHISVDTLPTYQRAAICW
jgi:hypothetical protein